MAPTVTTLLPKLAPWFGALLTLAFAPFDYPYAALVSLAFIYGAWRTQSAKRAALTGYLFGLGLFGSGLWWVYISIHDYGAADPFSATALTALLVTVWALFPALTGFLAVKLMILPAGWWRPAAIALLWVAVEYLRGYWLLNGFPWLQIAYSQLATPLAGFAPLLGVYGVGFLLAFSAFALVEVWVGELQRRTGVALVLAVWVGGASLAELRWTEASGSPIKITLLQGNISQAQKWRPDQMLKTLNLYRRMTEQHWDSDAIFWPETSIPAFLDQVRVLFIEPLRAEASVRGVDVVVGLPTNGDGDAYYNSVVALGESLSLYHKQHLLPFGEYLPLQPLSGWILARLQIPLGQFTAGSASQPLLQAGGHAFVTTICYEDAFGELVARQVRDAAYLVNMTNDAWFGDSAQPYQHMQMAQMRALETGRYLVRATNTGLTGFVGPDGKLRKTAPLFTTTALTDEIVPMAGLTPYARLGDKGVFGLLLLAVAAIGWPTFKLARLSGKRAVIR